MPTRSSSCLPAPATSDGLTRARAFAMHGIEQCERAAVTLWRRRYSLWTGDPGMALFAPGLPAGGRRLPDARRVLASVCTSVLASYGSFIVGHSSTPMRSTQLGLVVLGITMSAPMAQRVRSRQILCIVSAITGDLRRASADQDRRNYVVESSTPISELSFHGQWHSRLKFVAGGLFGSRLRIRSGSSNRNHEDSPELPKLCVVQGPAHRLPPSENAHAGPKTTPSCVLRIGVAMQSFA